MSIRVNTRDIDNGLDRLDPHEAEEAIFLTLQYYAIQAITMMRTGARWTDDTGVARQGLMAQAFKQRGGSVLVLWSQAPYGIWLEIRWSGKYAIVGPVLHEIGPNVLDAAGRAVMRLAQG